MTQQPRPYDLVRESCSDLLKNVPDLPVRLDTTAAGRMAQELNAQAVRDFGTSLASDANFTGTSNTACTFPSVLTEVAYIILLHALDFGSGWRPELHRHHGRGAWLTIKPGVEALYRDAQRHHAYTYARNRQQQQQQKQQQDQDQDQSPVLTSEWLSSVTLPQVTQAFGLQDNPSLEQLAQLLLTVIHDLGRGCQKYGSLEAFFEASVQLQSTLTPAGDLVGALVSHFPDTFDDRYSIDQTGGPPAQVFFYKKAQLVTGEIYHRFCKQDARFQWPDGDKLTAYVDNVIVATMRYKGVLVPNRALTQKIEEGVDIERASREEVALRAVALCGVEFIVQATGGALGANELGNYLWAGLGKESAVRQFQRHATKTVFY